MTLVQAWRDSLSLLKPKNLRLFVLVTLKSIGDTYKILAHYWWWLYAIVFGCFIAPLAINMSFVHFVYLEYISRWAYQILLFATLVATRPSLGQKDCAYFRAYMPYFLIMALFFILSPVWSWPSATTAFYFFINLFYLDSQKRISDFFMSLIRTVKMIVYNYPLILCVGIIILVPIYIVFSYLYIAPLLLNVIKVLLLPITVCLYANIYIKKVHDQFDLYFKQPN